ncbi:hypothetical protein BGZ95_011833 [Linnemannia exigua]|uniref:SLC41A/MgtE integral membrane domain-containing protein n=1 Tax=Linnemannia exigua TaxID=604196 RepID=A0AAD4DJP7_9FUNG|nr:hypothetical protein BGZ95_011833 [Linnemannia exigua]
MNSSAAASDPHSTHVLASDSDDDEHLQEHGILKGGSDSHPHQQQRQGSADSSSTIVSIDSTDGHPPKYARESFEYSEPGHDREYDQGLSVERGGGGSSGFHGSAEGESDKGLWMQALTTLVIAVSGLICAGWLLDAVQHWPVFLEISELIILIPILLNLKGNLEMNLASRLSTASNMGLLDTPSSRNGFIKGNLALLQLQSLTVGSVAGLFSFALGMIVHPTTNNLEEIALMISSSMLCASASSFILGSFMCGLVLICRHFHVNPDNIAVPLASSFGDLVTLVILSGIAVFMDDYIQTPLCISLLLILLALIPVWLYIVRKNKYVSEVVKEGWGPVFSAMVIASTAGLTLERYINQFPGMAMISPVLNGLTGNIGSIYASRISTALHANIQENYRSTEKTLFLVHIPIEVLFLAVISLLGLGDVQWSFAVVAGYSVVALTLVTMSLALAKWITRLFWKWGYDPDNYALPILTSLIDVLGTALLVIGFWALGYGKDAATTPPASV